jgi:hypothetical protein
MLQRHRSCCRGNAQHSSHPYSASSPAMTAMCVNVSMRADQMRERHRRNCECAHISRQADADALQSALRAQVCPTCTDLPYAHSTFRPTRTPCTEKHTAMSSSSSEEDDIVRRLERVHASCPSPIDAPTTATTLAAAPVPGAASAAAAFSSTPHSLFSHHVVSPRSRTPPHLQLGTGRRKHRAPTPSTADLLQKRVAQEAQQHARAIIVLQEPTTPTEEELEQMVRTPMQNLADSAKSCLRKLSSLLLLSLSLSLSPCACCAGG